MSKYKGHEIKFDKGKQPDVYQSYEKEKTAEQIKYGDIEQINYNIDSVF